MKAVLNYLKNEPQRVYTFAITIFALLMALGISFPVGPVSACVVAFLGLFGGEVVRNTVTPVGRAAQAKLDAVSNAVARIQPSPADHEVPVPGNHAELEA